MRNISKKAEFNFELIFAIFAGSAILILAIYGAVKFGGGIKYQSDSELAKQISIMFDPMQAGFAEGRSSILKFNQETRINNNCLKGGFGTNEISASTNIKGKYTPGAATSVKNKYIFSSAEGGKEYAIFSKQFEIGFKVSDLLLVTSNSYCFVNPPSDIELDIKSFSLDNFKVNNQNCDNSSINVCFQSTKNRRNYIRSCNITVWGSCTNCDNEYKYGYVEKGSNRLNYINNLMYAAVVSDYLLYNCNVKRLLYRTSNLASLYSKKVELMQSRSCFIDLKPELDNFANLTMIASESTKLDSAFIPISMLAEEIKSKNNLGECELW